MLETLWGEICQSAANASKTRLGGAAAAAQHISVDVVNHELCSTRTVSHVGSQLLLTQAFLLVLMMQMDALTDCGRVDIVTKWYYITYLLPTSVSTL